MISNHDHHDHPLPAESVDRGDRFGTGRAEGERQRFRWLDLLRGRGGDEGKGLAAEQQRLRSHVAQAGNILSPKGPIHAFVAQNPLQGLEHLPFDRAVGEAQRLLGGQGYLSNEAFRRLYASGRITQADLVQALETQAPHLASRPPIEVRGRRVEAREVCLAQLLYGIDPLPHGSLRWQVGRAKGTRRFRPDLAPETRAALLHRAWQDLQVTPACDLTPRHLEAPGTLPPLQRYSQWELEAYAVSALWAAALVKFGLRDPVSVEEQESRVMEALLHRILGVARDGALPPGLGRSAQEALERDLGGIGPEATLGEFCERLTGARLTAQINDQMIRWCAAFLDEGLAGWPMPGRERGFYTAWRALAERDLAGWFLGVKGSTKKIRQLPPQPEDAILSVLRTLGIPETHWTGYLTRHLAALPGWASMVKWREVHPDYDMQARYPIDLHQYLAVRLFYEAELVATLCRQEWGVAGTVPALHAYFRAHPGEYFARVQIAAGGLLDDLAAGVVRADQGAIALNWDAFTHPAYGAVQKAKDLSRHEQWDRFAAMLYVYRQGAGPEHHTLQAVCHGAWRLFHLAQLLGLSAEDIRTLPAGATQTLLGLLDDLPPTAHGRLWLQAYERHYREQLLTLLNGNQKPEDLSGGRPQAQVIFCLDAREEGIRRHLEAQSEAYETFGTAGFFSMPIVFRPLSDGVEKVSCPIVIQPRHTVAEVVRPGQGPRDQHRAHRAEWREALHALYHRLETNLATAYSLIDLLGVPFGITVAGRTLLPRRWRTLAGALRDRLIPPVPTSLLVEHPTKDGTPALLAGHPPDHHAVPLAQIRTLGFSPEEQADLVEGQLRMIGLTRHFARLVVFCGHGSTTENNPYAAAYHCGACGGNRGGPNARAIAAMANTPVVRELLRRRGTAILEDTHFLGAEHDTGADRFTFFDTEDISPIHREDFRRLAHDLSHAAGRHAQERCRRLPLAPKHPTPEEALRHVQTRSLDWAQVYPEWGHATCAVMLIGPRELTRGVFLDRRAYLQSYDPDQDPDGTILEEIMSAFIPVVRGISLDYYFSTVDSGVTGVLGAATKALHNVVGLIGVMQGAGGDIKTGLPAQGVVPLHEPMRVQVIVQSHPARVGAIIERHTVLANVFKNQWAHLIAWDPETGHFLGYQPDGRWETLHPAKGVPSVPVRQS